MLLLKYDEKQITYFVQLFVDTVCVLIGFVCYKIKQEKCNFYLLVQNIVNS